VRMKKLSVLFIAALLSSSSLAQQPSNCGISAGVGHDAYLQAVFDAKYPDMKKVRYMIEIIASETPIKIDQEIAYRSAQYIAKRLKDLGVRRVTRAYTETAGMEIGPWVCEKRKK